MQWKHYKMFFEILFLNNSVTNENACYLNAEYGG